MTPEHFFEDSEICPVVDNERGQEAPAEVSFDDSSDVVVLGGDAGGLDEVRDGANGPMAEPENERDIKVENPRKLYKCQNEIQEASKWCETVMQLELSRVKSQKCK